MNVNFEPMYQEKLTSTLQYEGQEVLSQSAEREGVCLKM